jgi:hypothetical protein
MADNPRCLYCGEPANQFKFYTKSYPSGKSTIENPILCCSDCSDRARQDLAIHRGGIEGVQTITFSELAKMKEKNIGRLCAKRGYEINHLANKIWRSLLFQIHYKNQPSKKEILKDSLSWYQKQLEGRIKNEFDRRLSSLLDCVNLIQEDLK